MYNLAVLISVSAHEICELQGVILDVRSESEFADAPVPGAVNVALLSDAERAEIGTLYKRHGPQVARARGLEIVRPKLESLYAQICRAVRAHNDAAVTIADVPAQTWPKVLEVIAVEIMQYNFEDADQPLVLVEQNRDAAKIPLTFYCWRGGARSKSMALFAKLLGFNAQFVTGGHKAFRNEVLGFLEGGEYPFKLCTLYGLTGSGKTQILRRWLKDGKPVIDLEALAHHRGSAFGQVGIDQYGKQKEFENNLYWELKKFARRGEKIVFVEGESRRIGRVQLPEIFMQKMLEGYRVQVRQTIEERVENILRDYVAQTPEDRMLREARGALEAIKKKLGGEKYKELSRLLDEKRYDKFTEILLRDYYDQMYQLSRAPETFYHAIIHDAGDWGKVAALGQ